jgi:hypothetical protein
MKRAVLVSVVGVDVMLACESDRPLAPTPPRISAAISDGGQSGFFFLPPLVRPQTPPPFSGVFDPNLAPVVQICPATSVDQNGACPSSSNTREFTTLVGRFNPFQVFHYVQVVKQLQFYFVLWHPDWTKLGSGVTYRIVVRERSKTLGFADIKVVASEDDFEQAWATRDFVPLVRGAFLLPILFRIEQGALCVGQEDCTEVTVDGAAQDVITTSQRAAIHFDPGSFSQPVDLVIAKIVTGGEGGVRCHITNLQQFDDCYSITVSPSNVRLNFAARVEICLNGIDESPSAFLSDPRLLVKSEPGVPGVFQLQETHHKLINCPNYQKFTLGPRAPGRLWDLASAGWRLVRGLVAPEPLHAASAASLVIDEGLGGVVPPGTPAFSHFGWVIPKTFSISAGDEQTAVAGTILPVNPKVCAATTHPRTVPAMGDLVTFTVTAGGGKLLPSGPAGPAVGSATLATGESGCAELAWRLGATGPFPAANTLTASVNFAEHRTVQFTATGTQPWIVGGTANDRISGLTGAAFLYNPVDPAPAIQLAVIQGPPGWNGGSALSCYGYQPPGTAANRAICWGGTPAVAGPYTATDQISPTGKVSRTAQFWIEPTSLLEAPQVTVSGVTANQVTVTWTASSAAKSFLVRINPLPFPPLFITVEKVVSGDSRSVTFTGLSLATGINYQAVVFAFSKDVMTPDVLDAPFNMAAHAPVFTVPSP